MIFGNLTVLNYESSLMHYDVSLNSDERPRNLSSGDAGRSLSVEQRSDGDDVSTLGKNEDGSLPWRTIKSSGSTPGRSSLSGLLRGRLVCAGRQMFRAIALRCSSSECARSHQTLLCGAGKISRSQLYLRKRYNRQST